MVEKKATKHDDNDRWMQMNNEVPQVWVQWGAGDLQNKCFLFQMTICIVPFNLQPLLDLKHVYILL